MAIGLVRLMKKLTIFLEFPVVRLDKDFCIEIVYRSRFRYFHWSRIVYFHKKTRPRHRGADKYQKIKKDRRKTKSNRIEPNKNQTETKGPKTATEPFVTVLVRAVCVHSNNSSVWQFALTQLHGLLVSVWFLFGLMRFYLVLCRSFLIFWYLSAPRVLHITKLN